MLTGGRGVHKNLTFAGGGEGGVQNYQKNADVINERPLNGDKVVLSHLTIIKTFFYTLSHRPYFL